jgi:predicted esterase
VATAEASQVTTASGRTWWHWKDIEPSRPSTAAIYSGWEASQSTIQAAIDAHWPIDGLLGFSQGATAIALYLSEHDDHALNGSSHTQAKESVGVEADATKRPRWAVLVSAFMPRDEACAARIRTAAPIPISSLHVHGTSDALVSRTRSEDLWKNFEAKKRRVYEHSGGHMVPTCSGLWKEELVEFLDAQH